MRFFLRVPLMVAVWGGRTLRSTATPYHVHPYLGPPRTVVRTEPG